MSTNNLNFRTKIRKNNVYLRIPQSYYMYMKWDARSTRVYYIGVLARCDSKGGVHFISVIWHGVYYMCVDEERRR